MKNLGRRALSIIVLLSALSACALPQTTVRTGSEQPSLVVKGAPTGTVLYVDGLAMAPHPSLTATRTSSRCSKEPTRSRFAKATPSSTTTRYS